MACEYGISGMDANMSDPLGAHGGYVRDRPRHRRSKARAYERREISEDAACELAASKLFRRLDHRHNGQIEEGQVLPLWPELARHMEGTNAAGMAASLQERTEPIGKDEWLSLMSAIRAIVGPRLFRSSIRAALEKLEQFPRSPSPQNPSGKNRCLPKLEQSHDAFLPGGVEPVREEPTGPPPNQPPKLDLRPVDSDDISKAVPQKGVDPVDPLEEAVANVIDKIDAQGDQALELGPAVSLEEWGEENDPDFDAKQFSYYAGRMVMARQVSPEDEGYRTEAERIGERANGWRASVMSENLAAGENVLVEGMSDTPKLCVFTPGQFPGDRAPKVPEAVKETVVERLEEEVAAKAAEAQKLAELAAELTGEEQEKLFQQAEEALLASEAAKAGLDKLAASGGDAALAAEVAKLDAQEAAAKAAVKDEEAAATAEQANSAVAAADAARAEEDHLAAQAEAAAEEVRVLEERLAQADGDEAAKLAAQLEEARLAEAAANAEQERQAATAEELRVAAEAAQAQAAEAERLRALAAETALAEKERAAAAEQAEAAVAAADAAQAEQDRLASEAEGKAEEVRVLEERLAQADGDEAAKLAAQLEEARLAEAAAKAEQEKQAAAAEHARLAAEAAQAQAAEAAAQAEAEQEKLAAEAPPLPGARKEEQPTSGGQKQAPPLSDAGKKEPPAPPGRQKEPPAVPGGGKGAPPVPEGGKEPPALPGGGKQAPPALPAGQKQPPPLPDGRKEAPPAPKGQKVAPPLPGAPKEGGKEVPESQKAAAPPSLPGGQKKPPAAAAGQKELPPVSDGGKQRPPSREDKLADVAAERAKDAEAEVEASRRAADATAAEQERQAEIAAAREEEARQLEIRAAQADGAEAAELRAKAEEARLAAKAAEAEQERLAAEAAAQAEAVRLKMEETERMHQRAAEARLKAEAAQAEREQQAAEAEEATEGPPGLPVRGEDAPPEAPSRNKQAPPLPGGGKQAPPQVAEAGKALREPEDDGSFKSLLPDRASPSDELQPVPEEGQDGRTVKPETPLDSKGRKPADVAEEEAFMRSYKDILKNKEAKRKAEEDAATTEDKPSKAKQKADADDKAEPVPSDKAKPATPAQTWLEQLDPASPQVLPPEEKTKRKKDEQPTTLPKSPSRGLAGSLEAESTGGVKLPALVHSQSTPGGIQHLDHNALIQKLQNELDAERAERERMSHKVKELEKKLQRSASQPAGKSKFFGVGNISCYKVPPVPPPPPSSPKRTQAFSLPALRTIPYSPNTKRADDEKAVRAAADANMERARDKEVSRAERSKVRIEAIGKLENQGMNSWNERKAEKVARLNDLTVFRESMWGSFFEWHDDYSLVQ